MFLSEIYGTYFNWTTVEFMNKLINMKTGIYFNLQFFEKVF